MLCNGIDCEDDEESNIANIEIVATRFIASSEMQLKQFLSRYQMKMALQNGNYFC